MVDKLFLQLPVLPVQKIGGTLELLGLALDPNLVGQSRGEFVSHLGQLQFEVATLGNSLGGVIFAAIASSSLLVVSRCYVYFSLAIGRMGGIQSGDAAAASVVSL